MSGISPTSQRTRDHLRAAALEEFRRRGFWATTMEHIRVAAGVSRGGLYYQYANTEEILLDAIDHERSEDDAADLAAFLAEQRETLRRIDETVRPIVYDYALGLPRERRQALLAAQFALGEATLARMLDRVAEPGDRAFLARQIVRRLEGLSIAAMAGVLDDADLDREIEEIRAAASHAMRGRSAKGTRPRESRPDR